MTSLFSYVVWKSFANLVRSYDLHSVNMSIWYVFSIYISWYLLSMNFLFFRNAIKDMVVRGAPAIAIAAALSLAVETFDLGFSGASTDAASFLTKKLEYLVSR